MEYNRSNIPPLGNSTSKYMRHSMHNSVLSLNLTWQGLFQRPIASTKLNYDADALNFLKFMPKVLSYRVSELELDKVIRLWERERLIFLIFRIYFLILQTCPFYDISSFFVLRKALFHKLVFFSKKNFFQICFPKIFFPFFKS